MALRPLRSKASCSSWRWAGVKRNRPSLPLRMMEESEGAESDDVDCKRYYVCFLCPSVASGRLLSASELSIRPRFQQRSEQVEFPKCRLWAAQQHLKQMLPCEQQPPGGRIELESKSPHDSSENSEKPQISGIDNQRITATYSGGLTPSTNACQP